MSRDDRDLSAVGPAIERVVARLGVRNLGVVARLEEGWEEVLGDAAGHARLVRYTDGEVLIAVDHPAWATRVQMVRPALEALAGEPLRLEIRVGREP